MTSVRVRQKGMSEREIEESLNAQIDVDSHDIFDEASDDGDPDYEPEMMEDVDEEEGDIIDVTESINAELDISQNQQQYLSKDKLFSWSTTPPGNLPIAPTSENIISGRMGVTSYAVQRITKLKDSFNLCITEPMKREIIRFSNLEGKSVFTDNFQEIDDIEFDAYLGVLILIGVYRSYGESIHNLWSETHGRPVIRAVMSLERFSHLSRILAFDDREARRSLIRGDKLAPIRDFTTRWTENLQMLYVPNETVTVDEQLIPFRGRCPFKVYMPNKPGKYGIKAWAAADSKTAFCLNYQIYLGKDSREAAPERNQGERVVLDLVSNFRGRNVTTDNFFTTRNLADELLKRKITIVGTVWKNKTFLPVHGTTKQLLKLSVHSSTFFFDQKLTIVRYVPKQYKLVTLLSTLHHNVQIDQGHPKKLPEIIQFYNSTKGGVDTLDQLVRIYSCKRQTNRWPVAVFSNFIDLSAVNAYVLWTEIHPTWNSNKLFKRRLFLQELGESLVRPHIIARTCMPRAQASIAIIRNICAEEASSTSAPPPDKKRKASDRKRCSFCIPGKEKKTFDHCNVCNKAVCPDHRHTTTIRNTYCPDHVI